jgi:diguanylate cyclase (GGDEF)-like protein
MSHHKNHQWNKAAQLLGMNTQTLKDVAKTLNDLGLIDGQHDFKDPIFHQHMTRERLTRLACYDKLTGLPNEFLFKERLSYFVALSKREPKNFAVMYIDIDHFKQVNDTLGHSAGDKALQSVAKILSASVRENDMVARLHGDEFVIMLDGVTESCNITDIITKKILHKIRGVRYSGQVLGISASIGISYYPNCGKTVTKLIKAADLAMYEAK